MEWDRQSLSVTLKGARGRQVFLLLRPVGKQKLGKGVVVDREKASSSACSGCRQVNTHRLHLSIPESLDSLSVCSWAVVGTARWIGVYKIYIYIYSQNPINVTIVHPSSTRQVKQAFSTTLTPIPFTVLSSENKKGVNKESSHIEPTPKVSITINSRCRKLCVNDKVGVKAACGHCFTQRTRITIDSIESGHLSHEVGYLAPSCPPSCCNSQSNPTIFHSTDKQKSQEK